MVANTPVVNAGLKYVNGFNLTRVDDATMTMEAGEARNSSDINDITLDAQVTINGASVGPNGCDIAVLAASTLYRVFVIGDSTKYKATAGLLSTLDAPRLPAGYDMYRRVGWAATDATSDLLEFWQVGEGQERTYYWDAPVRIQNTGASTTYTGIPLAVGLAPDTSTPAVPPLATNVLLGLAHTPDAADDIVDFLPYGSASTGAGVVRFGTGVDAVQVGSVWVPCRLNSGVPTTLYRVETSAVLTSSVAGFVDLLT